MFWCTHTHHPVWCVLGVQVSGFLCDAILQALQVHAGIVQLGQQTRATTITITIT